MSIYEGVALIIFLLAQLLYFRWIERVTTRMERVLTQMKSEQKLKPLEGTGP